MALFITNASAVDTMTDVKLSWDNPSHITMEKEFLSSEDDMYIEDIPSEKTVIFLLIC